MTLPAALQARLKKRGLIVKEQKSEEPKDEERKKKKSYKQQPLPPGWFKVPDTGTNHDYFWNVHTNQVSWRHPNDPKAEITYPASWQKAAEKEKSEKSDFNKSAADDSKSNKEDSKISKSKVKVGKHPSLIKAQKQKERNAPYRKGKDGETLDPMDPASYSDVARGSWSTGLREDSEVKTGVDTTASGPLFQQRPYPSPGDILRRNNKKPADMEE